MISELTRTPNTLHALQARIREPMPASCTSRRPSVCHSRLEALAGFLTSVVDRRCVARGGCSRYPAPSSDTVGIAKPPWNCGVMGGSGQSAIKVCTFLESITYGSPKIELPTVQMFLSLAQ